MLYKDGNDYDRLAAHDDLQVLNLDKPPHY